MPFCRELSLFFAVESVDEANVTSANEPVWFVIANSIVENASLNQVILNLYRDTTRVRGTGGEFNSGEYTKQ
jgi:hypothetical protein